MFKVSVLSFPLKIIASIDSTIRPAYLKNN